MASNYYKAMLILENNRKRWLRVNPELTEDSGIYCMHRFDENGFKYAYVGQAKKILTRLAQHLTQYEHIDLSLKKHGLYHPNKNPSGWNVDFVLCSEEELDMKEKFYIKLVADKGYQLRNKTSGGQDSGKVGIDNNKASKGYYDGLKQGYKNAIKKVKEYFDKYLIFETKHDPSCYKKGGVYLKEIYKTKFKEFMALLEGENEELQEETQETKELGNIEQ